MASAGSSCTASGTGSINDSVDVDAGGTLTYTLTGTLSPSATGTLDNTASVALPGPLVDPTPGNNTATDSDTITPVADLAITKTDNVTSAAPGTTVTYTVVASNNGPSDVVGATVTDSIPAGATSFVVVVRRNGRRHLRLGIGHAARSTNSSTSRRRAR